MGTFRGTLTNGEEHGAGTLAASWARPAVAEDSPLLRHQVVLESLNQQVLALRVVTHQQLCIHVAHQKVSPQKWQPHTLHQLIGGRGMVDGELGSGEGGMKEMWWKCFTECGQTKKHCVQGNPPRWDETYPRYMLPASIYIMFHPAQHSPVDFLFRWHIEIVTGDQIQDLDGRQSRWDILYNHLQEQLSRIQAYSAFNPSSEKHLQKHLLFKKDMVTVEGYWPHIWTHRK